MYHTILYCTVLDHNILHDKQNDHSIYKNKCITCSNKKLMYYDDIPEQLVHQNRVGQLGPRIDKCNQSP